MYSAVSETRGGIGLRPPPGAWGTENMVQAQVKEATPGTIRGFQPPREVGPFWAALTDDTNLPVFVIDNIGTIEFANDTAMRSMDLPTGASVVGRSLKDFYNEEIV